MTKLATRYLLALAIAALLLGWCFRHVGWADFLAALRAVDLRWLGAAFATSALLLAVNTFQMKLCLPRFGQVPWRRMFRVVAVFSMMVNVVPFWGGHALLVYWLGVRERVGKTVALSVLTLDQIAEGAAKLFLFSVVAFLLPFPEWMRGGIRSFAVLIAVAFAVLITLAFRYRHATVGTLADHPSLAGRLGFTFRKWAHHLHLLRSGRRLALSSGLSILMKSTELMAIVLVQRGMGLEAGWGAAFLVAAALSLATALPLTPGRLGVFEAAVLLVYQSLGVPLPQALALGLLIHAVHTLPLVVAGTLALWHPATPRRDGTPRRKAPDAAPGALPKQRPRFRAGSPAPSAAAVPDLG